MGHGVVRGCPTVRDQGQGSTGVGGLVPVKVARPSATIEPWTTTQALALFPLAPSSSPRVMRWAASSARASRWSATDSCSWRSSRATLTPTTRRLRTSSSSRPWPATWWRSGRRARWRGRRRTHCRPRWPRSPGRAPERLAIDCSIQGRRARLHQTAAEGWEAARHSGPRAVAVVGRPVGRQSRWGREMRSRKRYAPDVSCRGAAEPVGVHLRVAHLAPPAPSAVELAGGGPCEPREVVGGHVARALHKP